MVAILALIVIAFALDEIVSRVRGGVQRRPEVRH
jgi:hypothetical protein